MRRTLRALLFGGWALAWPGAAAANGRFPLANQLVVDPMNPLHMLARATFGVLDSSDGGATWRWICEDAIGYFGIEDPPVAITADGSALIASSRGLAVSRDGGCSWSKRTVDGGTRAGVDVTVDPANPHQALALESSFAAGPYAAILVRTADDGASWAEVATLPAGAVAETVEIAPSNPDRVYVTARLASNQLSVLLRSDDGGQTWTEMPMDLPAGATAFIGAVDPRDAGVVYVRVKVTANTIGRVVMTRDAGATWKAIWMGAGDVAGFALSGDGATVALGGPESSVRVAATADMLFREVNPLRPSCLTFWGTRLLACGKEAVDGFSIGISDDGGATFASMLHLADIAPQDCGASTSAAICAKAWRPIAETIGADAGTTPDGGDGGNGGNGGNGGDPVEAGDAKVDVSGGCSTANTRSGASPWAGVILAWIAGRVRRVARRGAPRHPGPR